MNSPSGTLKMERNFAETPERVFAFLTKMSNLLEWWGPEGVSITEHNLDFSRLGDWSATMVSADGYAADVGGKVVGIDPPNLVELTLSFAGTGDVRGPESLIRFELKPDRAGGTDLFLTQSGLNPDHISDMRNTGWRCAFERLETLVTQH